MNKEKADMIIYTTEDGLTKVETTFDGDTVWLSIDQMAELFQRDKSTISRHIKNIFTEGELQRNSVVANLATTATDGKTYQVDYYNLDVIISVGYRVKSKRGTQFRIWATGILKEYMRKGFIHCIFQKSAKQNSLCDSWTNCSRSNLYQSRCRKRIYGTCYF